MTSMVRRAGIVALVAAASLVAGRADAQSWVATLSGASEFPGNLSPATGNAFVSLTGNTLSINVTFSGLLAGTTASHIHCCTTVALDITKTAGVATPVPTFPGFPSGVTSGSYANTFDLLVASTYNPAFLAANGGSVEQARNTLVAGLNAGTSYLNVHTTQFPGGEIRGFLVVTPEPGTMLLLGSGLSALGAVVRRRRSAARAG